MLRWRLLLGAAFIGALAGLCWLDAGAARPGLWLLPVAFGLSLLASGEMLWLLSARDLRPLAWVVYGGNGLIVAASGLPEAWNFGLGPFGWPAAALALALFAAFCGEMSRYTGPGKVTERLGATVLSLCYVGLLLTFVIQLRLVGDGTTGLRALLSLVVVVKMCDTGAYTVGRLIGRRKMTPRLSPGKTWEGLAGGLAFACLGAWLALRWWPAQSGSADRIGGFTWGWLAFGLVVGVAGVVGDLAESLLKRDLGRKDSSPWMPGFGGVLDLLDSILLAAPAAYLCWALKLV